MVGRNKEVLSHEDLEFFLNLSGVYEGFATSSSDPVSVSSDLPNNPIYGRIYYDCTRDPKEGEEIMKRRIASAKEDIEGHYRLHKRVVEIFYDIDEALNRGDRKKVAGSSQRLVGSLQTYGGLVLDHQRRLGENSFLEFPHAIPGHIFYIPGHQVLQEITFGDSLTYEGLEEEIEKLKENISSFSIRQENIFRPRNGIFRPDSGRGLMDGSLRAKLETNRVLLERAGLKLG